MKLKKLEIKEVPSWRDNAGAYEGHAEFYSKLGSVALALTPEMCNKIFVVCADGILSVAREAAENLTCNVIEEKAIVLTGDSNG